MIDLSTIPSNPGCYLYKDNKGNIIYIGKAKDLKKRVSQYFNSQEKDPKTQAMISHIDSVDFIVTKNEVEALILENNLIKKNHPKYNIDLRDSKRYAYIRITSEPFPRLLIARKRDAGDDSEYFGPFTSGEKRDYIMQTLIRTFKIRTCKKLPKRPCLRFHLKLCDAPCIKNISKEKYDEKIKFAKSILNGKTKEIEEQIKEEMKIESKKQNFEKAIELRNQIESLEYLKERQNMQRSKEYNEDIINYLVKDNKVYLLLFKIYKGTLENKEEFEFDYEEDFIEDFLTQYYSENSIPKEIILPHKVEDTIKIFLEKKANKKINIVVPEKGEKKELLDLVLKNIEIIFFENINKLIALKDKLNLETIPEVIECFDISHLSGTSQVGSMVQFRKGKPDKSNYRKFKIRTVDQIDDFASIKEIVYRRYYRIKKENSIPPDLIIIDGGKGQLSSAMQALQELNIKIPIISIAKEFEEIYLPGDSSPLRLERKDPALQIVQQIRDEAHRFAINYNRLLRKKDLLK
ncbi:UvrABC system protein C [uncultured archaeon]|nr:UvrABC system protein C [uncultured archaeon]